MSSLLPLLKDWGQDDLMPWNWGNGSAKRDRLGFTAGVADEAVVRPDVELIGIDRLCGAADVARGWWRLLTVNAEGRVRSG